MAKFYYLLSLFLISSSEAYNTPPPQERLLQDLFTSYDSGVPGVKGARVDVNVGIVLEHFDFRERDGSFHFVGDLLVGWSDPRLKWSPDAYHGVTEIPISKPLMWIPDLEFYNNAPDKFIRAHGNGVVTCLYSGECLWIDTIEVSIFCSKDMDNWPNDSHNCKLSLGSWVYNALELDIVNTEPTSSLKFDRLDLKNMEYQITEYSAAHISTIYSCCTEPYTSIQYNIILQRNSKFVIVFRISALCIMIFSMLSLIIDPHRSEKLLLNGFSLILIALQLIHFAKQIGSFTHGTPWIVSFFQVSMAFVTFTQLVCVFCLMASRSRFRGKVPSFCSNMLKQSFVAIIAPAIEVSETQELSTSQSRFEDVNLQDSSNLIAASSMAHEWTRLSYFAQRSTLIVLSIAFAILSVKCYV